MAKKVDQLKAKQKKQKIIAAVLGGSCSDWWRSSSRA